MQYITKYFPTCLPRFCAIYHWSGNGLPHPFGKSVLISQEGKSLSSWKVVDFSCVKVKEFNIRASKLTEYLT